MDWLSGLRGWLVGHFLDQSHSRVKVGIVSKLEEQLVRHEGKKLFPYVDTVGKLTIGVGRNLSDVGISEAEALYFLQNDIAKAQKGISTYLPWTVHLDRIRYYVLVNMCFNLGIKGLLEFKNTLRFVENGKYKEASQAMLISLWAKQVGNRAVELAKQMETGEYTLV